MSKKSRTHRNGSYSLTSHDKHCGDQKISRKKGLELSCSFYGPTITRDKIAVTARTKESKSQNFTWANSRTIAGGDATGNIQAITDILSQVIVGP
jgi:hypothetical protein